MIELQEQHKAYYNKTAKDLPDCKPNNTAYPAESKWTPERVSETAAVSGSSYKARIERGGEYIWDRRFKRTAHLPNTQQEENIQKHSAQTTQGTQRRQYRMLTRPNRLTEHM